MVYLTNIPDMNEVFKVQVAYISCGVAIDTCGALLPIFFNRGTGLSYNENDNWIIFSSICEYLDAKEMKEEKLDKFNEWLQRKKNSRNMYT